VQQGSQVKLRVSKGPKPVAVPNVVGSTFESAYSTLLGLNFAVKREVVTSDAPKDTVVDTSPGVGTLQPPGTTITVMVSKGPTTSTVPDVTTLSQSDAQATLKASGFGVKIVSQPVTDQNQDGIVQTQDPPGGSQQPPGTAVTIAVGRFAGTPTPP
jgi:serine/threonine-protein kinase